MNGTVALWLAVTLGGALGCAARFGAVLAFKALPGLWFGAFPFATLFVNTVGGFAMGAIVAHISGREGTSDVIRLALTTGFLGGFTTFSAFSIETVLLWRDGQAGLAFGNVAANVLLSLAACAAGYALFRNSAT